MIENGCLWTANVIIKGSAAASAQRSNKSSLTKQLPGELMQYFHSDCLSCSFFLYFPSNKIKTLQMSKVAEIEVASNCVCQPVFQNECWSELRCNRKCCKFILPPGPVQCGLQCGRTIRGVSQH